jgi:acetyltransferase-like isoleucine patch superfamily enzyme
VNSTIRDGLTIAEGTFVAMAASVIKDTEAWGFYRGNPALKSARSSEEM